MTSRMDSSLYNYGRGKAGNQSYDDRRREKKKSSHKLMSDEEILSSLIDLLFSLSSIPVQSRTVMDVALPPWPAVYTTMGVGTSRGLGETRREKKEGNVCHFANDVGEVCNGMKKRRKKRGETEQPR